MSDAENHFEGLRELVQRHQPHALAGFDRLAHRMRAHKDDEIFALIEAAALSAVLAGQDVRQACEENRAVLKAMLDEHSAAISDEIAGLKKALAEAKSVPDSIRNAAQRVNVNTDAIATAAKEMSNVTYKVLLVFVVCSAGFGGLGTVLIGKYFHLL